MGSFNAVCAITHIPIEYGDDAVSLLVSGPRFEDQTDVHSRKYHTPFGFPFRTTYEDSSEFIITKAQPSFDLTMNRLKKLVVDVEGDHTRFYDRPINSETLTEKSIWDFMHRDRLCVKDKAWNKQSPISCIHIHKDAWEYLMNDFTVDLLTSHDYDFKKFRKYVLNKIDESFQEHSNTAFNDGASKSAPETAKFLIYGRLLDDMQRYADTYRIDAVYSISDEIQDYVYSDDVDEPDLNHVKKLVCIGLESEWIALFFSHFRKQITVHTYGGQEMDTNLYRKHAQLVLNMCDKIDKYYDEF